MYNRSFWVKLVMLCCVAKQLRECKYMKKIEQLEPFTT